MPRELGRFPAPFEGEFHAFDDGQRYLLLDETGRLWRIDHAEPDRVGPPVVVELPGGEPIQAVVVDGETDEAFAFSPTWAFALRLPIEAHRHGIGRRLEPDLDGGDVVVAAKWLRHHRQDLDRSAAARGPTAQTLAELAALVAATIAGWAGPYLVLRSRSRPGAMAPS